MIGNHCYADGRPAIAECPFLSGLDSMDTVVYFHFSPRAAHEYGWNETPTGVMSLISPPSTSNRDSVAGCAAPSHGLAEGCAAT
eukprot:3624652-Pyramimonas_sp.AAC.1